MPEPEKPERVPPETEMSEAVKLVEALEREKERVAVSPAFKEETSDVMAMVGRMVSMERVSELLESDPSVLVLPAESEKTPEATEMTPSEVLPVSGVKVAE